MSKLSVSTLYLTRDQSYWGTCAVVYDSAHVTRPSELSEVVIPRYRSDPRWGHPVWTTLRDELPKTLADDAECERLALALREHIESV